MNSDDVVHLAREEARAVSHERLQRFLPSADAHTTARARRDHLNTQLGISIRVLESIQEKENSMSTDQTNNPGDQEQDQEQHPADLYPFPAHWPITGPFANNTDQE